MQIIRSPQCQIDLDEFLTRPLFAHLATISEAGPRESPVWFLWEGCALWIIANQHENTLQHRLARQPRCALGIVDFNRLSGLVQHVGVRGQATLEAFDAERAKRLFRRYMGPNEAQWDARLRAALTDVDNLFICVVPDTVVVRDQSYTPPAQLT